jgi:exodeoxyribonuclease-3
MRVMCWNMRRARADSPAWRYLIGCAPDVALLQEVCGLPDTVRQAFAQRAETPVNITGGRQRFQTVLLVKGEIGPAVELRASSARVQAQLDRYRGCLVGNEVTLLDGRRLNAVSIHSPAWALDHSGFDHADVARVKLQKNSKVWMTDLVRDALVQVHGLHEQPWMLAGDLNCCETLDRAPNGWGGNREYLDRMAALGLVECLRHHQGRLTPTFRSRGGSVRNQIDHMFVTRPLADALVSCETGLREDVLAGAVALSDHLPVVADFA